MPAITSTSSKNSLADDTVKLLRCPRCQVSLVQRDESLVCLNANCRAAYPISGQIPQLVTDKADQLTDATWLALINRPHAVSSGGANLASGANR